MKKSMNCIFFVVLMSTSALDAMHFSINALCFFPLTQAIKSGDFERVKALLEQRKETHGSYSLNNETGNFYLQTAIEGNFKDIVNLLNKCCEVDAGDSLRQAPGERINLPLLKEKNVRDVVSGGVPGSMVELEDLLANKKIFWFWVKLMAHLKSKS